MSILNHTRQKVNHRDEMMCFNVLSEVYWPLKPLSFLPREVEEFRGFIFSILIGQLR